MRRFYILLLCLTTCSITSAQNLIEKYRSEPGQAWFNRTQLAERTQAASIKDYNQNGILDIWMVEPQQSEWMSVSEPVSTHPFGPDAPHRKKAFTTTRFHLEEEISRLLHGSGTVAGLDFSILNVDGEGVAEVLLHPVDFVSHTDNPTESILLTLDVTNETATELKRYDGIVGFFDVDGDQLADLIQYLPETRQIVVYGVPKDTPLQPKTEDVSIELRSGLTYQIDLKFEGTEGLRFPYLENALRGPDAWDFNGDGVPEMVLRMLDSLDRTQGIRIVNGANGEARFSFTFPENQVDMASGFTGFYNVDGQNGKEIYLGERSVLDRGGEIYQLPEHFITLGFMDIDGDTLPDILGRDTVRQRIQVYGLMTSTSTQDKLSSTIGVQLQPAYPNPMMQNSLLHLPVTLAKAERLQITLNTTQGRQLRTLFAGFLSAGEHTLSFDPGPLPKGLYVYRIHANGGFIARQVIIQ